MLSPTQAILDIERPVRPLNRLTTALRVFTVIPAELLRFSARVGAYAALLTDVYPSADEEQGVQLELPEPDTAELNRWLPLVKWLLVLPHLVVLAFLGLGVCAAVVVSWSSILFTGRYPAALFDFVVGVGRWLLRVVAYAFALDTGEYPPFRLGA